ncbi:MAG: FHA domain-containing protein [Deltaproteobacteria bacterium]|jgi:hypothetical protein|nr:FHA domain-containing protein [Deltaproteobacteria bacterium]
MSEILMKQCPACGAFQDAGLLNCENCGTTLVGVPAWGTMNWGGGDAWASRPPGPEAGKLETAEIAPLAEDAPGLPSAGKCAGGPVTLLSPEPGGEEGIVFQGAGGRLIRARNGDILGRDCIGGSFFQGYPTVSREHAQVVFSGGEWQIVDLASANKVYLGDCANSVDRAVITMGDSVFLSTACELVVVKC